MTVDETWVHYYEPDNKAQSRQWIGLWEAKGVIMFDFLPKRSTITGVLCKPVRPAENRYPGKTSR